MNNEEEAAVQLVAFLIELEKLCGEYELTPPIEVDAMDFDGRLWKFDFNPKFDSLELLLSQRTPPIILHLKDAAGTIIEEQITDLSLESEPEEAVCEQQNTERAI